MAKANYYLKSDSNKTGESLIYLYFSYDGARLVYSTAQTINIKHWNKAEQRAKKSLAGFSALNNYLQTLEQTIFEIYRNASTSRTNPTISHLKQELDIFLNKKEAKRERTFIDYFHEFIEVKKATLKPRTIQKFNTFLTTVLAFSKLSKQVLTFENMEVKFYDGYVAYRANQHKSDETIYKEIGLLKTFLHWATDREYNGKTKFIRQFKTFEKEKEVLSLTDEELFILYNLSLTNSVQIKVRDMFCFACFTGLRFSDVLQVSRNKVIGSTLELNQIKTKDKVSIHLSNFALAILERNEYSFPPLSNYHVNRILRQVATIAELDRVVSKLMISGKDSWEVEKPLKDAISFHVGRKSYVTISLKRGVRHETLMRQTGHKKLETLQKYISVSGAMKVEELNKAWNTE